MSTTEQNVKQFTDANAAKPMTQAEIQKASVEIETLQSKAAAIRAKVKPAVDGAIARTKAATDKLAAVQTEVKAAKSAEVEARKLGDEAVQYESQANAIKQRINASVLATITSLKSLLAVSKTSRALTGTSSTSTGQRHRFCENGNCTKCKSGDLSEAGAASGLY